jgi:hypothetical protein
MSISPRSLIQVSGGPEIPGPRASLLTPRSVFDPGDFVFILAKRLLGLSKNCKKDKKLFFFAAAAKLSPATGPR